MLLFSTLCILYLPIVWYNNNRKKGTKMITKPKGTIDLLGKKAKVWKYVEEVIDSVMEKYNYTFIRTPIFETTELFHRGIGDATDIVTKETYDFLDRGNRSLTLRPEGTAGVVRSYIENKLYGNPDLPVKVYYYGTMYRYERPQSGRNRELTQYGVEVLGSDDPLVDAEVMSLALNINQMLGLKGNKVHVNSLGDHNSREAYRTALKEYLKPYLKELCDDCKSRYEKNPLRILDCKIDGQNEILQKAPSILEYLNEESKKRFTTVCEYLQLLQVDYVVDPKIVRGLDYYNHTVFEIHADIPGFGNANVLGGGGRYNNLVKDLGGPETSCVGFAAGVDRLIMALEASATSLPISDQIEAFILYVNDEEKKYAAYLTQELRLAGFKVETEYLNRSLKGQFKQADRLHSQYLILLNSDDLKEGWITIKNNQTKEEEKVMLEYAIYYLEEHLAPEDSCDCGEDCHAPHRISKDEEVEK